MEYSETENRPEIELIIDQMRREICTIWHRGSTRVPGSAPSPRPELKITAALSGADWQLENVLHIRAGFVQTQH